MVDDLIRRPSRPSQRPAARGRRGPVERWHEAERTVDGLVARHRHARAWLVGLLVGVVVHSLAAALVAVVALGGAAGPIGLLPALAPAVLGAAASAAAFRPRTPPTARDVAVVPLAVVGYVLLLAARVLGRVGADVTPGTAAAVLVVPAATALVTGVVAGLVLRRRWEPPAGPVASVTYTTPRV
ncbi:hypothetical protein AB6N24_15410 [Cellulomonas sp. 179-A 4D5 NHS]|uniref:hypothetical protein n=1 Tax=Cellulomonas sp. 179-A 4D5 NHS TaxID=3142378 RepID=UPI0039A2C4B2